MDMIFVIVCANITYDPFLFAIILDVTSNNRTIIHNVISGKVQSILFFNHYNPKITYQRTISGKNPPPFCAPLVIPSIIPLLPAPQIDLCIKLFNIYTPAIRNFHICMDWEIKMFSANIVVINTYVFYTVFRFSINYIHIKFIFYSSDTSFRLFESRT